MEKSAKLCASISTQNAYVKTYCTLHKTGLNIVKIVQNSSIFISSTIILGYVNTLIFIRLPNGPVIM